ncbi:hypothetical protein BC628DRAFT_1504878 [Trametes gibbosa]|nr:hypothetical protein BC628DRAFT_1504878 [Trametes gibbosa]
MSQDPLQTTSVPEGQVPEGVQDGPTLQHASLSQGGTAGGLSHGPPSTPSFGSSTLGMGTYPYHAANYHPIGGVHGMHPGWDMLPFGPAHMGGMAGLQSPMSFWPGTPGGAPDGRGHIGLGPLGQAMAVQLPSSSETQAGGPASLSSETLQSAHDASPRSGLLTSASVEVSKAHAAGDKGAHGGLAEAGVKPSTKEILPSLTPDGDVPPREVTTSDDADREALRAEVFQWVVEAVEEELHTSLKPLIEAELEDLFARDRKARGSDIPQVLQNAVHEDMRFLLGVREKMPSQAGTKKTFTLPEPLEPGEDARYADDGSPLHNPNWFANIDAEGPNKDFVAASVALVQQNAVAHNLPLPVAQSEQLIHSAVTGYFKSLKRKYQIEHGDLMMKERNMKKKKTVKDHSRKHRRADALRIGMEAFEIIFGKAATVGLPRVVCTPCVSDEANSDGEAGRDAREACRKKADVGPNAWEVRTPLWRSPKLTRLYIVLAVLSRFVREHEDVLDLKSDIESLMGDTTSEDDMTLEVAEKIRLLRARYQTKVEAAVKGWSSILVTTTQRIERFRGPIENARMFPPTNLSKHTIYKEFLSENWVGEDVKHSRFFTRAPSCPSDWTILDLELPDSLIPVDDLTWLTELDSANSHDVDDNGVGSDDDEYEEELRENGIDGTTTMGEPARGAE